MPGYHARVSHGLIVPTRVSVLKQVVLGQVCRIPDPCGATPRAREIGPRLIAEFEMSGAYALGRVPSREFSVPRIRIDGALVIGRN